MSVKDAILATQPTTYWPLDDLNGSSSCHDEMGLHNASLPLAGVTLSVLPVGTSQAPFFDGALGSVLTIPDDPRYSQPFSDALAVAAWLCPLALNNANVVGGQDKYIQYVGKAAADSVDAEWPLRFYNQLNETRLVLSLRPSPRRVRCSRRSIDGITAILPSRPFAGASTKCVFKQLCPPSAQVDRSLPP
jgi:hypothetical protein